MGRRNFKSRAFYSVKKSKARRRSANGVRSMDASTPHFTDNQAIGANKRAESRLSVSYLCREPVLVCGQSGRSDGRSIRLFNVSGDFTHEALGIEASHCYRNALSVHRGMQKVNNESVQQQARVSEPGDH